MPPTRTETVANDLSARIARGEFPPGGKLPSESELVAEYGYSRTTIRTALSRLAMVGLVTSHAGVGTLVRDDKRFSIDYSKLESRRGFEAAGDNDDPFGAEIRRQGGNPREEVEKSEEAAPPYIAERLQITPGELVVVRRRRRYDDRQLLVVTDSYFPMHVAMGTPLMEQGPVMMRPGILAAVGKPYVRVRDELHSRETSEIEAKRLDTHVGAPLTEAIRTGYAADGEPLRCMVTLALGSRITIVYELEL